jgi:hypothetical protein
MQKIKSDIEKNRLYITITGTLSVEEAEKAKKLIFREIETLKPNFDVINDISKFIRGADEAGPVLKEIMAILISKNVNRVVRVVGTSKTGLLQFANYSIQADSYKLNYVPTLEEAEKLLDQKE